jgi:type II secretory pathway pseudopilin PulG
MSWSAEPPADRPRVVAGRSGFVLLEAVIALAVISLFAIALLAALGAQVRTADKAAVLLVARPLAEERMATLRMLDFETLDALPDSLAAGSFPAPFGGYTWRAEVALVPDQYDLFAVEVTVSAGAEAYPLRTLLHRPRPLVEAAS